MAGLLEYMREALTREPKPNPQYGPSSDALARQEASGGLLGAIDPYTVRPMDAPEHRWVRKNLAAKDAKGMVAPDAETMERIGMAGIFGGLGSKTADLDALKRAMAMKDQGVDNEAIRKATGWFTGMDSRWKYEIPDNAARYTENKAAALPVGEAFEHKELFAAYPDLAKLPLVREQERRAYRGTFRPSSGEIRTYGPDDGGTILHELQHAVQVQEGFAAGGGPNSVSGRGKPGVQQQDIYDLLAGEIEAQDVSRRRLLDAVARRDAPPTLRCDAIVTRYRGAGK